MLCVLRTSGLKSRLKWSSLLHCVVDTRDFESWCTSSRLYVKTRELSIGFVVQLNFRALEVRSVLGSDYDQKQVRNFIPLGHDEELTYQRSPVRRRVLEVLKI